MDELKKEKNRVERFLHFLVDKLMDVLLVYMPIVTQIPANFRFPVGFAYLSMMAGTFITLFIYGYQATVGTKYLAPLYGGEASNYCDMVPTSTTGDFYISMDGFFEGSPNFEYSEAAFRLTVKNYLLSYNHYREGIELIKEKLIYFGNIAEQKDLGENLILWSTLVFVNQTFFSQRWATVGDPVTILSRDHTTAMISNAEGDCTAKSNTFFDHSTGSLGVTYNIHDFMANPTCNNTINPVLFGYDAVSNPEHFTLKIDVRTLFVTLSLLKGIITLNDLQELPKLKGSRYIGGNNLSYRAYIDPKFSTMSPVVCFDFENPVCFLVVGERGGFPFFSHVGKNLTFPERCDCQRVTDEELADPTSNCNVFRFLTGIFFWPEDSFFHIRNFQSFSAENDLNDLSYNAAFLSSPYGRNSPLKHIFDTPEKREEAFSFCSFNGLNCSILTFTSYDSIIQRWSISPLQFQLPNGACRNTFQPGEQTMENLLATPFSPLHEEYQICHKSPTQSLLDQAGIATGNVSLLKPIMLFLVVLLVMLTRRVAKIRPSGFTQVQRYKILESFANALLRVKDSDLKKLEKVVQETKEKENPEGFNDLNDDMNGLRTLHCITKVLEDLSTESCKTKNEEDKYKYESRQNSNLLENKEFYSSRNNSKKPVSRNQVGSDVGFNEETSKLGHQNYAQIVPLEDC